METVFLILILFAVGVILIFLSDFISENPKQSENLYKRGSFYLGLLFIITAFVILIFKSFFFIIIAILIFLLYKKISNKNSSSKS